MHNKFIIAVLSLLTFTGSVQAEAEAKYDKDDDTFSIDYICEGEGEGSDCHDFIDRNEDGRVDRYEMSYFEFKKLEFEDGSAYDLDENGEVTVEEYHEKASRDEALYLATLAYSYQRYDDAWKFMMQVFHLEGSLSSEERDLFENSYKHKIMTLERQQDTSSKAIKEKYGDQKGKLLNQLSISMDNEKIDTAHEKITALDEELLPYAKDIEDQVLFLKMRADSFFYLCKHEFERYEEETTDSFEKAWEVAEKLPAMHILRLELAWNYTLYLWGYLKNEEKAVELAYDAYDDAWSDYNRLSSMDDGY